MRRCPLPGQDQEVDDQQGEGASEKEPSREPWPWIHILQILSPPSLLFPSLCVCVSATATSRRKKSVAFEESGADKKGPEPENGTQAAMRRIRKQSAVITGMTGFFSGKEEGDEVLSLCPVPHAHTYNRHLLFVPCGNLTLSRCAGVSRLFRRRYATAAAATAAAAVIVVPG